MNFIKHVLTEYIDVYPTSEVYWKSIKKYHSLHSKTSVE